MLRTLLPALLLASVAVAQQPPAEVIPLPDEVIPPPGEVTEAVRLKERPISRITIGGEIGPVFGGWGLWRSGTLVPPQPFGNRPHLFPIPVAEYAHDVKQNYSLAARVVAGYSFEQIPVSVSGSWETFHRNAETLLLGYDPYTAHLLAGLNAYNTRMRRPDQSWYSDANGLLDTVDTDGSSGGDHRQFPRLQLRTVPSEQHRLQSRVSANVADFTLAYKIWTPREASGVQYHLLVGGRYGGFFADDRARGPSYEQSAYNWFGGFGPHGGLRIDYGFGKREDSDPAEFRLWADARAGALYGQIEQRFAEFDYEFGGSTPFREQVLRADRTVPFVATELGFGVFGPRGGWLSVGVRYSHYWGIGNVGASQLDFGAVVGFLSVGVGF